MSDHKSKVINIVGQDIYYQVLGQGSPLIFIHGAGNEYSDYDDFLKLLSTKYTVYAYNFPSYHSESIGDISLDLYMNILKEFISRLHLSKVDLCGYSLGGGIALAFAVRYPEFVNQIIAICPIIKPRYRTRVELMKDWFVSMSQKIFEVPILLNFKKEFRSIRDLSLTKKIINFTNVFDIENDLESIQSKCLIFLGKNDKYLNFNQQYNLLRRLENREIVTFDNGSHYLIFTRQEEILSNMLAK